MQFKRGNIGLFFKGDPTLKLWLPFEEDGNYARDLSGNGNHGTNTNIIYSAINGRFGTGAGFNGSSSKIVLPDNTSLRPTTEFTVMEWIKTSATSVQCFFSNSDLYTSSGGYSGFILDTYQGKLRLNIYYSKGTYLQTQMLSSKIITDGIWHFICSVYGGGYMYLYIDGRKDDANPVSSSPPQYNTTSYPAIGSCTWNQAYSNFFNGLLDEAALFNRALSHQEISQYYSWAIGTPKRKYIFDIPPLVEFAIICSMFGSAFISYERSGEFTITSDITGSERIEYEAEGIVKSLKSDEGGAGINILFE